MKYPLVFSLMKSTMKSTHRNEMTGHPHKNPMRWESIHIKIQYTPGNQEIVGYSPASSPASSRHPHLPLQNASPSPNCVKHTHTHLAHNIFVFHLFLFQRNITNITVTRWQKKAAQSRSSVVVIRAKRDGLTTVRNPRTHLPCM